MKYRKFLKTVFAAAAVIAMFSHSAFALGFCKTSVAKNNTDFAKKSAEIVSLYDAPGSKTASNSSGEMLRIIGRASSEDYDFSGCGANACVVSPDGRFLLQFNEIRTLLQCLKSLNDSPEIIYAERDVPIYTCADEEQNTDSLSWGASALGMNNYSQYLSSDTEQESVTVAIVDSGVSKIDFVLDKLVGGYDFIDNDSDGANDTSSDSHGTFLASIVADCTRNTNVNIMPVRVLDSKTGTLSNAVNGIYYAVDNGADVVNISLCGALSNCRSLDDAIAYAEEKNVTVVVCAGNVKSDMEKYCPAHNVSAITVTAVNESLEFASGFSNYGSAADVCAPGTNIAGYSADGTLKAMNGTSMSAAYISACTALFRLQHPECNAVQVQSALKNTCTDLGDEGFDIYYGYGIPQMQKFITDETVYVESVSFDENEIAIEVGDEVSVSPDVLPLNATDKSIEWFVSNRSVVSVNSGTVTGISAGTAVLTVLTSDGGYSASLKVTVTEKTQEPYLTAIYVKSLPSKTVYTYKTRDALDLSGIVLEAVYSNGEKEAVTDAAKITAYGYSFSQAGEQTVTVEYENLTAEYQITVEYTWWQQIIRILLLGFLWY